MPPLSGLLDRAARQWRKVAAAVAALSVVAALAGTFGTDSDAVHDELAKVGLGSTYWLAAVIFVVLAAALAAAHLNERDERRRLIPDVMLSVVDHSLVGVKASYHRTAADDDDYVHRPYVEKDMGRSLTLGQWIVVTGDEASGVTRTAFEGLRGHFNGEHDVRLFIPALGDSPAAGIDALFATVLPWRMIRRPCVLWLDDFGPHLLRGESSESAFRTFLDRHANMKVVATISSADWFELKGCEGEDHYRRVICEKAIVISVPPDLVGPELTEAARLHPGIPRDRLPRLAEYRLTYDELMVRLNAGDVNQVGRACVLAAIDWSRGGPASGAPEAYLKAAAPAYLNGPIRRRVLEEFEQAMEWAEQPFVGTTALLEQNVNGRWLAPPSLVDQVRRTRGPVPADVWKLIVEFSADSAVDLYAIASAAADADEPTIVVLAGEAVQRTGDPRFSGQATDLLLRLLSATGDQLETEPALLASAQGQRAVDLLTARSPAPTKENDDGRFATEQPYESLAQRLYRYRAVRFVLRTIVLVALDSLSSVLGLAVALVSKAAVDGASLWPIVAARWTLIYFCIGFALPCLVAAGAYRTDSRRAELDRLVLAFSIAAALAGIAGLAHGEGVIYSTAAWASFVFAMPICFTMRRLYDAESRRWVRNHDLARRTLLVGRSGDVLDAKRRLVRESGRPTVVVGYLATDEDSAPGIPRLGGVEDLVNVVFAARVHHVVVVGPAPSPQRLLRILDLCTVLKLPLYRTLTMSELQVSGRRVSLDLSLPIQRIAPPLLTPSAVAAKRIVDLVLSGALLALLGIPMLIIAALIKVTSKDTAIDRSPRPRLGGKDTFAMRRFRKTKKTPEGEIETWLGRFMNRTAIDELPQLLDVFEGSMSLVGPRPLPPGVLERMEPWQLRRYVVKPGITGLSQVTHRAKVIDYAETARFDLLYISGWSIWRDFEILIRTAFVVVLRPPAQSIADNLGAPPAGVPDTR